MKFPTVVAFAASFIVVFTTAVAADPPGRIADIAYKSGADLSEYERTRCKLDLYLPAGAPPAGGFPCVVWFHGGSLKEGNKRAVPTEDVAKALAGEGIAVAAVDYRLSPAVRFPAYVEDAAAAFVWTRAHAGEHGLDPERVFTGGHSAGAYLALMLAMDRRYLEAAGAETDDVAGVIAVAGQTVTHSTVREERGIGRTAVVVDEAAPLFHVRAETPPILLLFGDDDLPIRAEENRHFAAALKAAENGGVRAVEVPGRDHGTVAGKIADDDDPAREAILTFVRRPARPGESSAGEKTAPDS